MEMMTVGDLLELLDAAEEAALEARYRVCEASEITEDLERQDMQAAAEWDRMTALARRHPGVVAALAACGESGRLAL